MASSFSIHTLGCKANSSDSDALSSKFLGGGWLPADADTAPDLIVINTCSVTDAADRQSAKLASRLKRAHPQARIVVTGCAAEANPQQFAKVPGIDWVVGNRDRHRIPEWASQLPQLDTLDAASGAAEFLGDTRGYDAFLSRHPLDREWPVPELFPIEHLDERSHTRLFLKIQEGCDSFCTYCIIPYGRGPSRSLPAAELLEHVRSLVQKGIREIVLTGTNLGDYGLETLPHREQHKRESGASGLVHLIRQMLRETEIERIRLSSLDPNEIGADLRLLVATEPRICAHFHVSVQSPVSSILKRMKRGYTTEDLRLCLSELEQVRGPNGPAWIGMDMITGFPGETDEAFEASVQILKDTTWSRLHVFPYSERAGTPATRLPQSVPPAIRKERASILRQLSFERMKSRLQPHENQLIHAILWEGATRGPDGSHHWLAGTTSDYLRVIRPWNAEIPWQGRNTVGSCLVGSMGLDPISGEGVLIAKATNH